jgi:hypothetical protein
MHFNAICFFQYFYWEETSYWANDPKKIQKMFMFCYTLGLIIILLIVVLSSKHKFQTRFILDYDFALTSVFKKWGWIAFYFWAKYEPFPTIVFHFCPFPAVTELFPGFFRNLRCNDNGAKKVRTEQPIRSNTQESW